jgi:hypothetical protein
MNDRQLNKLMMFKGVRDCMQANDAIVATVPAVDERSKLLTKKITGLQEMADRKATVTVGKTDLKYEAEENLISEVSTMSSVLSVWATVNKRLETKAIAGVREYVLRTYRDEQLIAHARVIQAEARAAGAELAHFGMSEAKIEEFGMHIDAFEKALGTRDSAVNERVQTGDEIEAAFSEVTSLLVEQLDPLMEIFRTSHPHFYESYHSLRVIKALAVRYHPKDDTANSSDAGKAGDSINNKNTISTGDKAVVSNGDKANGGTGNPAGVSS